MTYFGFLAWFLAPPLLLLLGFTWLDHRRGRVLPLSLRSWPATFVLLAHVIVAVIYTTPWDNYLVATGVWWYNPKLVTGVVMGWVPIEEYTFFVLQTILTGLWIIFLAKRLAPMVTQATPHPSIRWAATALVGAIWVGSLVLLLTNWQPGTYLGLILVWALVPITLQMALGGDILWRYRRLVFWALAPATLYLSLGDGLAIRSGTWTVDPAQSTGIFLGSLPLEEFIFFLVTNTLVVFGMILVLAQESQARAPKALLSALRRLATQNNANTHPISPA
ncbi:MAG: lycopene cyclase domain-containing protein [Chloroflexi bacterium]|nr:lycopene cyclase domain-containing protein [Chloroflexota bacterium]